MDPRWLWVGAGALCLGGFALGLELLPWASRGGGSDGLDGSIAFLPDAPMPPAPPRADRLPRLSFDDLMGLLGEEAGKPAAQKFAKAFMREPVLKKTYEEYRDGSRRGGSKDAKAFLSTLRGFPEFRRLMSHFASEPGFRQMAGGLLRKPEIEAMLIEEKARQDRSSSASRGWTAAGGSGRGSRSFKEGLGSIFMKDKNATGTTAAKVEGNGLPFTGEAAAGAALQQPGVPGGIGEGAGAGQNFLERIVTGTPDGARQPPAASPGATGSPTGAGGGSKLSSPDSCYSLLYAQLCGQPSYYCDGIKKRYLVDGDDLLTACGKEGVLDKCQKALNDNPACKKSASSSGACADAETSMRHIAVIEQGLKDMASVGGGIVTLPVISAFTDYGDKKAKAEEMLNKERCSLQTALKTSPGCKNDAAVYEAYQCKTGSAPSGGGGSW